MCGAALHDPEIIGFSAILAEGSLSPREPRGSLPPCA
jgi:hypothetical protein